MKTFNIKNFSKEMIAGQRLMVGFDGTEFSADLEYLIDTLKIGGIILFARNIRTPQQIKELTEKVQKYAKDCNQPPLFIAIDQEGGEVARLKKPFTLFPEGNPGITNANEAQRFADITAEEMKSVGLNMDMAPVMDVEPDAFEGIMNRRVFKGDVNKVSYLGTCVIEHLQKNKIMAVAKHFPGIGRTTLDSHLELPYLDTDANELLETDILPFKASIKKDVSGIMLSHILYEKLDSKWPASLSKKIAKNLLRKKMGFKGLVLTDDLDMKAIQHDMGTQIERILSAEIDIVLICHKSPKIETAFNEILKHLDASQKFFEKGLQSCNRIIDLKAKFL